MRSKQLRDFQRVPSGKEENLFRRPADLLDFLATQGARWMRKEEQKSRRFPTGSLYLYQQDFDRLVFVYLTQILPWGGDKLFHIGDVPYHGTQEDFLSYVDDSLALKKVQIVAPVVLPPGQLLHPTVEVEHASQGFLKI